MTLMLISFAAAALVTLAGCGEKSAKRAPATAPPPTYTGPAYLRGTVGSLARIREGDDRPMLVSQFGLVVYPRGTGTGSAEVPAFLRQRLINDMRKRGLGSARLGTQALSPTRFLASKDTAVVRVEGLIPPGAVPGTPFDVVVTALPQTQTTSLAGASLWTTELAVDGANTQMQFSTPLAEAKGTMYLNPFDDTLDEQDKQRFLRQGVIIAGGKATKRRRIELILNQPSWLRSRAIADRINERFPAEPDERIETAEAKSDLIVELNIPRRFAAQPQSLLELVGHLYIQRGVDFEPQQAQRLAQVLQQQPGAARRIMLAWRSLGKTVIPVLREYYDSENLTLSLASLEAGAWLGDEHASRYMLDYAEHADVAVRKRIAEALVYLPDSIRGGKALKMLIDDDVRSVRIAAYEALAHNNDRRVLRRFAIEGDTGLKFVIDQVLSDKPMVYVTQESVPRLVLFGPDLSFESPSLAQLWNSRLMLRTEQGKPMSVYYQPPNEIKGKTYEIVPTVATFAYLLAHKPTLEDPQDGLDMTFSQVVDAVYHLCKQGAIPAPIEVKTSQIASLITGMQEQGPGGRPETSKDGEAQQTPAEPVQGLSARPETAAGTQ